MEEIGCSGCEREWQLHEGGSDGSHLCPSRMGNPSKSGCGSNLHHPRELELCGCCCCHRHRRARLALEPKGSISIDRFLEKISWMVRPVDAQVANKIEELKGGISLPIDQALPLVVQAGETGL